MDELSEFHSFFAEVYARILRLEENAVSRGFGERLSVTEIRIIEKIGEREPSRMSEVSAALGVTMATLTVACDRLQSKGFVLRVRDGKDRRVVNLSLTDAGHAAYTFHQKFHEEMMQAMMEEFTPEQAGLLAASLHQLQSFLDKHEEGAWFYGIQVFYLAQGMTLWQIILTCFVPTIGADVLKCLLSAILATKLVPALHTVSENPENISSQSL